jgi:UDP-N-acetylmuramoyl-tripeptide--D-alanyl-D-alanine ligase
MIRGSLAQLLPHLEGASLQGADCAFEGVSTDSRNIPAGALFVALRGERFDAHDFLADVAAKGAVAVIAEQVPAGFALPALIVPDTLLALGAVARFWRAQFALPVAAVTGSNGKTTVKEMIAAILAEAYGVDDVLATRGNLNNEIGVPLSVFRLDARHRAAVLELGMNHPGEIARLAAMAMPTVALVNNAQREHQEFMVSVEAVAIENGAVLASLGQGGIAVYPADDEYTPIWKDIAGSQRSLTFGLAGTPVNAAADVSCTHSQGDFGSELSVSIRAGGATMGFPVSLQAAGLHNVRNALAAIAVTYAMGVPTAAIAAGLSNFAPVSGRLQRKQAAGGALVIDDTYNANPDSARAAIDVLAGFPAPRVFVLGDMGEVGDEGPAFHTEIGQYAQQRGIGALLCLGELTRHACAAFGARAQHFDDVAQLQQALDAMSAHGTTILVKGSRFMKMERVVAHLAGPSPRAPAANNKDAH